MAPTAGESGAKFVLRVEPERRRLGISDGETLRAFKDKIPAEMRRQVQGARLAGAVLLAENGDDGGMQVKWAHYVGIARQVADDPELALEHPGGSTHVPGRRAPPAAAAAAPTAAPAISHANATLPPPPPLSDSSAVGAPSLQAYVKVPCKLCKLLGRSQATTHTWEDCFGNPRGAKCKVGVFRQRMGDLAYRNIPIPEYMNHALPDTLLREEAPDCQNMAASNDPPVPQAHVD